MCQGQQVQPTCLVQAITLPMILTPPYKDLIAQAHNGSGKTTCFVLSMLSRWASTALARQGQ